MSHETIHSHDVYFIRKQRMCGTYNAKEISMTPSAREEIEKVAESVLEKLEDELTEYGKHRRDGQCLYVNDWVNLRKWISDAILTQVAKARAEEREKLAQFMLARNFSTGHGDTIEDLLKELDWNINKLEKE